MTSISSSNRPVRSAARNRSATACCSDLLTRALGRRAATCSRARRATCRTVATDFPTTSPISPYGVSKTSWSTDTARSVGPSVSSTVSIAIETLSASSTSSATSGLVSSGSGSHSPTCSSRLRDTVRSRVSPCRVSPCLVTIRTRHARGSRTCDRSTPDHRSQGSCSTSSASAADPSIS
ncbi:hypothetical protein QFZ75_003548 [Streptomyces sp. V3I8]|nr:hypothetical protein [Streptomyces sp. V3I8]